MGVLDDYKLHFERLPSEAKKLRANPYLRAHAYKLYRQGIQLADRAEKRVSAWRLFKRLGHVEDKLDKPFLYESGMLDRIERLETLFEQNVIVKKSRRKAGATK